MDYGLNTMDQKIKQMNKNILFSFLIVALGSQVALAQNSRSEEHTSELQSLTNLVCRLLLEKKNNLLNNIT